MREMTSLRRCWWLILPCVALAFVVWVHWLRADRVSEVSRLDNWSVDAPRPDAKSPSGWEAGRRNLILTLPSAEGHQWIAQTQQMLSSGQWRVRHVDYDNAPTGRPTAAASAYRWWLGGLAWCDNLFTDVPLGWAVERTSLYANPLLQVLLILGALPLVKKRLGVLPAVLFGLGAAWLYPFSDCFAPGLPGSRGLALVFLIWTFLPLVFIGLLPVCEPVHSEDEYKKMARSDRIWFVVSGLAGAGGLWVDGLSLLPAFGGLVLGAVLAAVLARRKGEDSPLLASAGWRCWGLSLGLGGLVLYLADYFPYRGSWRLGVLNPLDCLAGFGLGELLGFFLPWLAGRGRPSGPRAFAGLVAGGLAVAAVPVVLALGGSAGFFEGNLGGARLSDIPGSVAAPNAIDWWLQSQQEPFWAGVLPLLGLLVGAVVFCWRAPVARSVTVVFILGPLSVFAGLSGVHLSVFGQLDAAILLAAVACTAGPRTDFFGVRQWVVLLCALGILVPGARLLVPDSFRKSAKDVTDFEQQEIFARDLAHWLSSRVPDRPAVILAPPDLASSLCYYGGLRVVGSMAPENEEGFLGAVRIAKAGTLEEAVALVQKRQITQIVLPSSNRFLDDFIGLETEAGDGGHLPVDSFLYSLRHWVLPPWLQPMAYPIPKSMRERGEFVTVFSVVEDQDEAVAIARLAEYFAENAMRDRAAEVLEKLNQYPGDPGVLAALAQVQVTLGDKTGLDASLAAIESLLPAVADMGLAWDRRLSLALFLVQAHRNDQARQILASCLTELDETKLRALSLPALVRFLTLAKLFNLPIPDPHLKTLAVALLPPQLRSRI